MFKFIYFKLAKTICMIIESIEKEFVKTKKAKEKVEEEL